MSGAKKTNKVTARGRPIWVDNTTGEQFSEKTITVPYGDGWVVIPTVDDKGRQYSEDSINNYVKKNGPIDWLTNEKLPIFDSIDKADSYAKWRSDTMFDKEAAQKGFNFNEPLVKESSDDYSEGEEPTGLLKSVAKVLSVLPALRGRHRGLATYPTIDSRTGIDIADKAIDLVYPTKPKQPTSAFISSPENNWSRGN